MPGSAMSNPLTPLFGYQLRRASAAAMDELARDLAKVGIRPTEGSVLILIGANPGARASDVGRELGIQRANMTPLVAGLERRGLLKREPVDGRSHGLRLTPVGDSVRRTTLAVMHAHDKRLLLRVCSGSAEHLAASLEQIWPAIESEGHCHPQPAPVAKAAVIAPPRPRSASSPQDA
jgi:DNA-binding MarR family transcriptional regulator